MDQREAGFANDLAHSVSEVIQQVCLEDGDWSAVAGAIQQALPGTFVSLFSANLADGSTDFAATSGLEHSFVDSYSEHFAFVNPWNDTWTSLGERILVSEDMLPASLFRETEFYQDWLKPLREFDAGVGIRLNSGSDHIMYTSIHYSPKQHDRYGFILPDLYTSVRRDLLRALDLARIQIKKSHQSLAKGAIAHRFGQCAIVVFPDMRVLDANESAVREFELGRTARCLNGRLHLTNHHADQTLNRLVRHIARGDLTSNDMFTFQDGVCMWLARVAILRSPLKSGLGAIARNQNLALILLEQMTPSGELASQFSVAFRLTPSEYNMCSLLAKGINVQEAAVFLNVAESTARQRLKTILSKTGTNRQSELVSLMRIFRT